MVFIHLPLEYSAASHREVSWDRSNMWQLQVNVSKCNILRIGCNCVHGDYAFDCDVFPRVEQVADLGIIVDTNLKFSNYINKCRPTSKAFSRSFLIFKGFSSRN